MYPLPINKKFLRIKLHYFLYLGGVSSISGYAPTLAKQLGYSPFVVGSIFTYLSFLSFIVKPVCGFVVDKFAVKRIGFLSCILVCGLAAFLLKFIDKLPTETIVNLSCDTITKLDICSNEKEPVPQCSAESLSKLLQDNVELIDCQLLCQQNELFWEEMCKSWNITDFCRTSKNTLKNNDVAYLNVSLSVNLTDQVLTNSGFQVRSVQIKENEIFFPFCRSPMVTRCEMNCDSDDIMLLTTIPKSDVNIFGLYQFWGLIIVMTLFWASQAITWSLQDPICFDLLDDKPENFGKQRCWGSISWGLFTILGGVLVDYFSKNEFEKNYSPIFYLCLVVIILDFTLAYKIKVKETTGSKNTVSDIFTLLNHCNVLVFFMWIIGMGIGASLIWNYLFWHMEDITSEYHSDKQLWIKTLQGLTIGIQCLGGELPLLFFSGWIIKRIGHWYCMALGLLAFAVRFYLYSIITNPLWILPVEMTNGITFGLGHAVLMSYARKIAPPNAITTVIGFSGSLFEGVGVSIGGIIGGYLFENYKGAETFLIFSYGSFVLFILLVVFIKLNKSNACGGHGSDDSNDLELNSPASIKAAKS